MGNVKAAIVYYSSTGTNYELAKAAAEGVKEAGGEAKIVKVTELAPAAAIESNPAWKAHVDATKDVPTVQLADLEWADAIIFSTPTRFGNMAAQMKQFLDTTGGLWFQGKLANKVVSAMTSASNAHGGQEATVLSLYTTMYHWGAIVVAPGYTDPILFQSGGNPYGTSATVVENQPIPDTVLAAARHQAKRVVTVAGWVKNGQGS
ncbi:NAD(P)H:quinone oxidoreductase [Paenibacillus contaminans]|jgi:NAD(P)H dehydrogenase (quinone)|uniref:NAD(P)H:quinone oxidoreductase, type IV n=1 Tax=Paenibacillus contaminans TaxID=450362 RepID=A0A329MK87_9BACL|nr:NAD(P)H:quinone oxidoreductase [Paenibacillus contaminans]RAV20225.1 NAD(P)H:quinone oxidoreductase, type IV [Paenibacillus contaminans]